MALDEKVARTSKKENTHQIVYCRTPSSHSIVSTLFLSAVTDDSTDFTALQLHVKRSPSLSYDLCKMEFD